MERNINKLDSGNKAENDNSFSSVEEKNLSKNERKIKKKEINSWDCSSPSPSARVLEGEPNDWDSSDCQETTVEPFDNQLRDCNSEKQSLQEQESDESRRAQTQKKSSFDFADLSFGEYSEFEKSGCSSKGSIVRNEDLQVEDMEEFSRDENLLSRDRVSLNLNSNTSDTRTRSDKVRSNISEGTPEDTTIWIIPKSERPQSADTNEKITFNSDREKIQKPNVKISVSKVKSYSNLRKEKKSTNRTSRSECLGSFDCHKKNLNKFLLNCEGSSLNRKSEMTPKKTKEGISNCENFDRTRVFFTEYDCRPMTMNNVPPKLFDTSNDRQGNTEEASERVNGTISNNLEDISGAGTAEETSDSEAVISEFELVGPSAGTSLNVVSLPDMIGKNSMKERTLKEKFSRRMNGRNEKPETKAQTNTGTGQMNESWFLLDESGQYQAVTRNEVTILLNGRSADAVLQSKMEHLIPSSSLCGTSSPSGSITGMLPKESWQHFLREEDLGGEDRGKKLIDLERKMENTLLYIQPGMNLTASIRIIPVDTEMIHLWRRTRDNESSLSSEVDLRFHSSQDSVNNINQRYFNAQTSFTRRLTIENPQQTVAEQDENISPEAAPEESQSNAAAAAAAAPPPPPPQIPQGNYADLLIETRMMVDSLTNYFKTLQTRLDGETTRSLTLQGELNKLKHTIKNMGGKIPNDKNSSETHLNESDVSSSVSFLTAKQAPTKAEHKTENSIEETIKDIEKVTTERHQAVAESKPREVILEETCTPEDCVTVNIYTVEDSTSSTGIEKVQRTNSLLQINLGMIEGKMKLLQEENEFILLQNNELKRKLKEISLELEKYLVNSTIEEDDLQEEYEKEALNDQVCNLKLELDTLKKLSYDREKNLKAENSVIRKESPEAILSLEKWFAAAYEIFQEIKIRKSKLREVGIEIELFLDSKSTEEPKNFSSIVNSYLQQSTDWLIMFSKENALYDRILKETDCSNLQRKSKEMDYIELIEQYRKGAGDADNKVLEDYFEVIKEKALLNEEIKILKTENEILLESQTENYEKLKQAMIALKDRKNEITALESSQELSEEKKNKMMEVLKFYEEEKKFLEFELSKKIKTIDGLSKELENKKAKELEVIDLTEKLKAADIEIKNFEKLCHLKEELINEYKMNNDQLMKAERTKNNQAEIMKDKIKNLEEEKVKLESELASVNLFINESQKETREYIKHLESVINNTQETLDKTKQKFKESSQSATLLKNEIDILEKQHQCDLKLYNKTKDELESCKGNILSLGNKLRVLEEEKDKLLKNIEIVANSEKEKSDALEVVAREYQTSLHENADLKENLEKLSKDNEDLLKEHKNLINKYAVLSKEVQKLQNKYRKTKAECNERTDLIQYLEMMLKENLLEYNKRIACLESNISHIIEKIVACKNCVKVNHSDVNVELKELRHQLDMTYQERKELEHVVKNYYTLMKHLENEVQERDKKMDELHERLMSEKKGTSNWVNVTNNGVQTLSEDSQDASECLKIEELQNQVEMAEKELFNCRKELQECQIDYEKEKKKSELIIADLKSEISRYQIRIEVMMKNLSNFNVNADGLPTIKRNSELGNLLLIKKEAIEKNEKISELTELINRFKTEMDNKNKELESSKENNCCLNEELKSLRNQISRLQDSLTNTCKNYEIQKKERDEMATKLVQSLKLLMEERSARQSNDAAAAEKEKKFHEQLSQFKEELMFKSKEAEALCEALEDKKKLMVKLQGDLKKAKIELTSLKNQISEYNKTYSPNKCNGSYNHLTEESTGSVKHNQNQFVSSERLDTYLKELKEVRDLNLQLRKAEGQYQAKIIQLEDDIRNARLLIKELQGDIKTEKKSKKALKNMIISAKMEIEKCLLAKQIIGVVAERISRHLDLSDIPSRELLSGFRLSDSVSFQ